MQLLQIGNRVINTEYIVGVYRGYDPGHPLRVFVTMTVGIQESMGYGAPTRTYFQLDGDEAEAFWAWVVSQATTLTPAPDTVPLQDDSDEDADPDAGRVNISPV